MNLTVLIVDDNAPMRRLLQRQLKQAGVPLGQVYNACDGREALQVARRHHIDLILTDLQMPEMGGLELLRALRDCARTAGVPALVVTASASEEALREALSHGARACLRKPVVLAEMQQLLAPLLARTA